MKDKSGIYKISFLTTDRVYIGSSINIRKRKNSHLSELRRGIHQNSMLQNAYNKYGENNMIFTVILECEPESLLIYEEEQIRTHNSYHEGFNLVEKPSYNMLGYKHTEQTRTKMSSARKELGRVSGCLTEQQVREIRQKFFDGARNSDLAEEYGIHRKTIRQCVFLQTYTDIPCEISGYVEMLQEISQARCLGIRPRSTGWKHKEEFIQKIKQTNSRPKQNRILTEEQIRDIRKRHLSGETYKTISQAYGINQNSVSRIIRRLTYYDIE
jgi:DNA-directed RNA polymerase specialized sigma24 family protein